MKAWTYCRNCVAWRMPLDEQAIAGVEMPDVRVCRLKSDVDNVRHADDGCCEGVPVIAPRKRGGEGRGK